MPTCPQCKADFTRLKHGACPLCGTELKTYSGVYYRADTGSPTLAILSKYEKYMSEKTSERQGMPITFTVSKKSPAYRRELVEAERILVGCDSDLDLALLVLEVAFKNPQFSKKSYRTLMDVRMMLDLLKSVAVGTRARLARQSESEAETFESVMQRENIFN